MPGRETFPWPAGPRPVLAVKRFGAGGGESSAGGPVGARPPWRDRWYARLRGRPIRCPARVEFDNLRALREAGFHVPRPVDWAEEPGRGLSVVTMEWVRHGETLRERLEGLAGGLEPGSGGDPGGEVDPDPRAHIAELSDRLATFVARFHGEGFYHRDLYLHHFVLAAGGSGGSGGSVGPVEEEPGSGADGSEAGGGAVTASPGGELELCLLDLGRVRRERSPRKRWLIKDLGALLHSFPAGLSESARSAFFQRYFELAGPATLPERDRWMRAIRRRARRIAAHVPRHSGRPPTT